MAASDALFSRLSVLPAAVPTAAWRELLAHDAFAEPAALAYRLRDQHDRPGIALLLAARLADQVAGSEAVDPHFLTALRPFWFAVATVNLSDWQFWQSPRQPLRRVLQQLLQIGRGYSLSSHPASVQFPQRLQTKLQHLAEQAVAGSGADQLLPLLKSLYELLRQVHEQQRQSDRRLLEQEAQNRRTFHAQVEASRAIRQAVWSQPVPASVVSFLDDTWRKYLYLLHLKQGMQQPAWQQAVHDIQLMVWLASEASPTDLAAEVNGQLPGLLRRIREALAQTRTDAAGQEFPQVFAALLAARARNVPDAGLPLGELPDDDEVSDWSGAAASAQLANRLPMRGDCLLLRQADEWRRVRVLSGPPEQDFLLLADFAGSRVAAMNPAEAQLGLQEDRLRPLPKLDPVMQLLPQLPGMLKPLADLASETKARQRAESLRAQQAEASAAEQARLAALAEAERAKAEARAQADRAKEAARAEAYARRQQQEAVERAERVAAARRAAEQAALQAEQQRQAASLVASLRSGALVELRREDGQYRSCYLAMIRTTDQHYVFVDRLGKKLAEHSHEALLALVLDAGIRVLESGSALDSTLQNLVSERRQFLNEEDGG